MVVFAFLESTFLFWASRKSRAFTPRRAPLRRGFFVVSGEGGSKSAGTEKRARSRGAIVRLRHLLPLGASLTRLGVPRYGTMSAQDRPC